MQKLSSKERYLTTFSGKEPDRVPIFLDVGAPRFFSESVKWYTPFEKYKVLLELDCDPIVIIWLPTPVIHRNVKVSTWREKTPDGQTLLGKQFDTPKGALRQVVRETEDWCDFEHGFWVQRTLGGTTREEYSMHVFDDWNISRRIEPWVKSYEDLEKLSYILQKPDDWQLDEWRHDAERAIEFAQKHNLLTMVRRTIVSDASQWFCDIPWFMLQLYDNPQFVEQFLAIFEEIANWQVELALDLKPDVFQHRAWYAGPDFWGGKHFENYILPVINRQADIVHQTDTLHCFLMTEGWGSYIPQLQAVRSDMLWGADPFLSRADLKTIKRELGQTKTIIGGTSSEHHLVGCDEQTTRRAVRDAIEALAQGGRYVLASSSSIWFETEWQLISAMIDEAKKIGRYE